MWCGTARGAARPSLPDAHPDIVFPDMSGIRLSHIFPAKKDSEDERRATPLQPSSFVAMPLKLYSPLGLFHPKSSILHAILFLLLLLFLRCKIVLIFFGVSCTHCPAVAPLKKNFALQDLVSRHFAAASLSLKVTRSFDAVRMLTMSCLAALTDVVMRIIACDTPSPCSLHYSGKAKGEPTPNPYRVLGIVFWSL